MGKRSGGGKNPVDHYRRQLGKHEKHLATSRSRDAVGVSKSSKHASNSSTPVKPKFILKVGLVLVLLLIAITVIYFIGFMGVVQVLYDAVEVVTAYWRGPSQAGSKDKSASL